MDKKLQAGFYRSFLHPLISIGMPYLFLSAALVAMTGNAAAMSGVRVFPPGFGLLLLLAGFSETVIGNRLVSKRAVTFAARLRELAFVILISAVVVLMTNGQLFSGAFNPGAADFWVPLLVIALQWTATLYIHSQLRKRDLLLSLFRGTDPAKAKETYHGIGTEANEAVAAVKAVRTFCALLGALGFAVIVAMAWPARVPFDLGDAAVILGFFGFCFACVTAMNTFLRAQAVLMDGLVAPRPQKRARTGMAAALLAVSCLIAVPLTGRKAVFPESYLVSAYEWARSLGRDIDRSMESDAPEVQSTSTNDFVPDYMGKAKKLSGERRESGNIAAAVGWVLLAAFLIGVAAFLFVPLLRRGGEGFHPLRQAAGLLDKARESLQRVMDSWSAFRAARRARRDAKAWDRTRPKPAKTESAEKKSVFSSLFGRRDQAARAPIGKYQRAFQKFVHWGEKRGVRFSTNLGAMEYAVLVAEKAPEAREGCTAVAALFERIVFSGQDVSEGTAAEYHEAVDRTVRS